jgi:hypothetical protein
MLHDLSHDTVPMSTEQVPYVKRCITEMLPRPLTRAMPGKKIFSGNKNNASHHERKYSNFSSSYHMGTTTPPSSY